MSSFLPTINTSSTSSASSDRGIGSERQGDRMIDGELQASFKQTFAAQLEQKEASLVTASRNERTDRPQDGQLADRNQRRPDTSQSADAGGRRASERSDRRRDAPQSEERANRHEGPAAKRSEEGVPAEKAGAINAENRASARGKLENSEAQGRQEGRLANDQNPGASRASADEGRAEGVEAGEDPLEDSVEDVTLVSEAVLDANANPFAFEAVGQLNADEAFAAASLGGAESAALGVPQTMAGSALRSNAFPVDLLHNGPASLFSGAGLAAQSASSNAAFDTFGEGLKPTLGLMAENIVKNSAPTLSAIGANTHVDTATMSATSQQSQALLGQAYSGQAAQGALAGQGALGSVGGELMRSTESFSASLAKRVESQLSGIGASSEEVGAKLQGLVAMSASSPGSSGLMAGRLHMPVTIAFGQSGWAEMVADRSAMMAAQSIKFAEIQLDPPELGQLQVKVTVNQDQASVSFIAPNAQVKEALDQTVARLKEMLQEQGLDLVDVDVSDQSSSESSDHDRLPTSAASTEDGDGSTDGDEALQESQTVNAHYGVDHYA